MEYVDIYWVSDSGINGQKKMKIVLLAFARSLAHNQAFVCGDVDRALNSTVLETLRRRDADDPLPSCQLLHTFRLTILRHLDKCPCLSIAPHGGFLAQYRA